MTTALTLLLLLPLLVALPCCIYLVVLTVAAPFGLRMPPSTSGPPRRFAVLVPAHDEECVIGRLLMSLAASGYPAGLVDTYVVADNCTDATAVVARAHGAWVLERHDQEQIGKGYALRYLLAWLAGAGLCYDGYVVLDADSVVSAGFFDAMARRLAAGSRVVQARYGVLSLHCSRAELLREASLALVHYLRPAAKSALGVSCGLKGNGMCFDRSVVARFGWPSAGLAEDVEFHLALVAAGIRVTFAPEAVVLAEMPASLRRARSQNLRWEGGRLATVRRLALPLLLHGLGRRDLTAVDAAVEQLVPPISVPAALALCSLAGGLTLRIAEVWVPAAVLLQLLLVHLMAGLTLARVRPRVYAALAFLPLYIPWKAGLYARSLFGRGERRWIRTERAVGGGKE